MLVNFENLTKELNQYELKKLLPKVLGLLSKKTKKRPIKAADIVDFLVDKGYIVTQARLRKCVNFIRCNGLLPLIGTSKGYYCSNDEVELQKQIKSLNQRANSIKKAAKGLKKFTNK